MVIHTGSHIIFTMGKHEFDQYFQDVNYIINSNFHGTISGSEIKKMKIIFHFKWFLEST